MQTDSGKTQNQAPLRNNASAVSVWNRFICPGGCNLRHSELE